MTFLLFSSLLNGLAATVLGLYIIYRYASTDLRRHTYGVYCLSLSIWSYFYVCWQYSTTRETVLLFIELLMAGTIMIPVRYLHHTLTILCLTQR